MKIEERAKPDTWIGNLIETLRRTKEDAIIAEEIRLASMTKEEISTEMELKAEAKHLWDSLSEDERLAINDSKRRLLMSPASGGRRWLP